jgi:hypothetical protein
MPGFVLANAVDVDEFSDVEIGNMLEDGIKGLKHIAEIFDMTGQLAVFEGRDFDRVAGQERLFDRHGIARPPWPSSEEAREGLSNAVPPGWNQIALATHQVVFNFDRAGLDEIPPDIGKAVFHHPFGSGLDPERGNVAIGVGSRCYDPNRFGHNFYRFP